MERTPGRNWINTGYGANVQSVDFGSPSGGRGKPVKMYVQPFSSPPVIGMRSGCYNGGYPMCIVYPQVCGHIALITPCITRFFSPYAHRQRPTKIAICACKSAATGCYTWELSPGAVWSSEQLPAWVRSKTGNIARLGGTGTVKRLLGIGLAVGWVWAVGVGSPSSGWQLGGQKKTDG